MGTRGGRVSSHTKLKIMYGSKTNKTANLDTISIQIFTSMCIMYLIGGYSHGGGAGAPLAPPPLSETRIKPPVALSRCALCGFH